MKNNVKQLLEKIQVEVKTKTKCLNEFLESKILDTLYEELENIDLSDEENKLKEEVYIKLLNRFELKKDYVKILHYTNKILKISSDDRWMLKKIETLKYFEENSFENINKEQMYEDEILKCFDKLICFEKDNRCKYVKNKFNYIYEKIQDILFADITNEREKRIAKLKENLMNLLSFLEREKDTMLEKDYIDMKFKILITLERYEEAIYFYRFDISNENNSDEYFKMHIDSLYTLRRIEELRSVINSRELEDEVHLGIKKLYDLRLEIIDKNENNVKLVLDKIEENNKSTLYKLLKKRALQGLKKLSDDESYTKDIEKFYYEELKLKQFTNNIDISNMSMKLLEKSDAKSLYHYTSIEALKGFVENKQLWITAVDFLNDFQERRYVLKYIEALIYNLELDNKESESEFMIYLNLVLCGMKYYFEDNINTEVELPLEVREYIDDTLRPTLKKSYVLSMSKNEDSLTLWGNYSKNDGYNVGIDREVFCESLNCFINHEKDINSINGEVLYRKINTRKDIEEDEIYQLIVEYYDNCKKYVVNNGDRICGLITNIIYIGLFMKDKLFENEEEYRMVVIAGEVYESRFEENFRVKNSSFIPFIKVPIERGIVNCITIGPNNNSDITEKGLRGILEKNGFKVDKDFIKKSKIPLRY